MSSSVMASQRVRAMTGPKRSPGSLQSFYKRTAIGELVQSEHCVGERILLRFRQDAAAELLEFADDILGAGKGMLAAARRFAGLALDGAVAETNLDLDLVAVRGAERGDRRIVHDAYL